MGVGVEYVEYTRICKLPYYLYFSWGVCIDVPTVLDVSSIVRVVFSAYVSLIILFSLFDKWVTISFLLNGYIWETNLLCDECSTSHLREICYGIDLYIRCVEWLC